MTRRLRLPLYVLIGLIVLLLCLHLAAPLMIRHYLNEKLADMGDYRGQVTDVDLAWWRGAYRVEGLEIVKVNGKVPVPFLKAPGIDIAVSWRSLWQEHAIVGRIVFERPELNFVDGGARKEQSQTGEGTDWQDQVDKLISITLDEVRVVDGRVTFRNFNSKPQVNLTATDVNASLYNLTNAADARGERIARFEGKAAILGSAPLEASARFDPFKDFTDFDFRLRVTDIDLPKLNDFARAYGKFDFRAGSGDVVVEAKAVDGRLSGYVKPLMKNVDIFDWQQDVENRNKNALESAWEAVVGTAQTLLKNQPRDQFATRVDLSGSVKDQNISPLQAFFNILRNAFVRAFSARYDAD